MIELSLCGAEPNGFADLVEAAAQDAELDHDKILVLGCKGQKSSDGYLGMTYPRAVKFRAGESDMDLDSRLDVLNAPGQISGVRVAVCVGYPEEIVAGLIRHEFEHARQFDAITGQPANALHDRAIQVLEPARGLPNAGQLYGQIPMQRDANAASALFLRTRYRPDRIDQLMERYPCMAGLMRRPSEPPTLDTIEERMTQFVLHDGPQLAEKAVTAGTADGLRL